MGFGNGNSYDLALLVREYVCACGGRGGGELKDTRKRKNRIFLGFDKNAFVLEEKKSYRNSKSFKLRSYLVQEISMQKV